MTEAEWLTCTDPVPMVSHLRPPARSRRAFLFYHACCHRFARFHIYPGTKYAADRLERLADALPSPSESDDLLVRAEEGQRQALQSQMRECSLEEYLGMLCADATWAIAKASHPASSDDDVQGYYGTALEDLLRAASLSKLDLGLRSGGNAWGLPPDPEESVLYARLLRDIFGNPFRAVTLLPKWRTSTAAAIAREMYESRDFSAMPILADALQDAECEDADVLDHCRRLGPHARGCWVVDFVLGKE